jgi:hypothetical protein
MQKVVGSSPISRLEKPCKSPQLGARSGSNRASARLGTSGGLVPNGMEPRPESAHRVETRLREKRELLRSADAHPRPSVQLVVDPSTRRDALTARVRPGTPRHTGAEGHTPTGPHRPRPTPLSNQSGRLARPTGGRSPFVRSDRLVVTDRHAWWPSCARPTRQSSGATSRRCSRCSPRRRAPRPRSARRRDLLRRVFS